MPAERIEQRPRLRAEEPPTPTTLVVRGGPDNPDKLQRHTQRTGGRVADGGRCWVLGLRGPRHLTRGTAGPPVRHVSGCLPDQRRAAARARVELLPTGQRPHLSVRLCRADVPELARLRPPWMTAHATASTVEGHTGERRTGMYHVDITADLNDEDDTGDVRAFLDEARRPGQSGARRAGRSRGPGHRRGVPGSRSVPRRRRHDASASGCCQA